MHGRIRQLPHRVKENVRGLRLPVLPLMLWAVGAHYDRRPLSLHQSTRPCLIQKWQRQSFSCRTDGETAGRFSQPGTVVHFGLSFLLRESLMISLQPPGQWKQAHLLTPSRSRKGSTSLRPQYSSLPQTGQLGLG